MKSRTATTIIAVFAIMFLLTIILSTTGCEGGVPTATEAASYEPQLAPPNPPAEVWTVYMLQEEVNRLKAELKEAEHALDMASIEIVDINTGTKEDFLTLPGIGNVTANRIIEKRTELQGFSNINDLLLIERFGEKKLETLLPFLKISTSVPYEPKKPPALPA